MSADPEPRCGASTLIAHPDGHGLPFDARCRRDAGHDGEHDFPPFPSLESQDQPDLAQLALRLEALEDQMARDAPLLTAHIDLFSEARVLVDGVVTRVECSREWDSDAQRVEWASRARSWLAKGASLVAEQHMAERERAVEEPVIEAMAHALLSFNAPFPEGEGARLTMAMARRRSRRMLAAIREVRA